LINCSEITEKNSRYKTSPYTGTPKA